VEKLIYDINKSALKDHATEMGLHQENKNSHNKEDCSGMSHRTKTSFSAVSTDDVNMRR